MANARLGPGRAFLRTIETRATVTDEGTLTIKVPPDIPPGEHRVVVLIEDATPTTGAEPERPPAALKAMDWKAWPADCTFRREDLYGDDGR